MKGTLYLCATPIGNLKDITLRCIETLESVDLIAAEDTRQTLKLLNHFDIHKPMTSYFEHNKKEKGEYLISLLNEGQNIALVSDAGTPAISDPGEDLARMCIEAGIDVVPVPGAVAGISALIVSGMATGRFTFEGFLSVNKRHRLTHLNSLKDETRTMIFYEAPHKLPYTLKDMEAAFGSDRRITLCRELTKIHEEKRYTTIGEANQYYHENPPRGEFVLIIEGAIPKEEPEDMRSLEEIYAELLDGGMDEKEALKEAAKQKGIAKRDAYAVLKVKKDMDKK